MQTVWSISGQPDVYTDSLTTTDGYKVTAFLTWNKMDLVLNLANTAADVISSGSNTAIGTCVETLDSEGETLAARVTTTGNYALCHWMYFKGQTEGDTYHAVGGTNAANWGETRYYNEVEWGTSGSHITGANIQSNGTPIDNKHGFALSDTSLTTGFINGGVYSMSWY